MSVQFERDAWKMQPWLNFMCSSSEDLEYFTKLSVYGQWRSLVPLTVSKTVASRIKLILQLVSSSFEIIQSEVLDWFPFSSARLEPYVLVQLCFKVPASVSVSSNVLNGPYGVTVAFLCRADENITLGFFLSTAEYHCFVLC